MNRRNIRVCMFAVVAVALTGCNTIDDLLGNREGPRLEGSRIPVLLANDAAQADPGISDLAVLLPRPIINTSWPQQGGFPNHAMHHLAASGKMLSDRFGSLQRACARPTQEQKRPGFIIPKRFFDLRSEQHIHGHVRVRRPLDEYRCLSQFPQIRYADKAPLGACPDVDETG